ncbi:lysine exporter LysO family protein [Escherichia coli]|nr:lysine exporter LysO family protein [Escherichia coli]
MIPPQPLDCTGLCGATSMDFTLPVSSTYWRAGYGPAALFHGFYS